MSAYGMETTPVSAAIVVDVVVVGVLGCEMKRDERRIRPVEEPRREAAMLAEREPVPDGIRVRPFGVRVLAEVS